MKIVKSRPPAPPAPPRSKQSCSCAHQFSAICFRILAVLLVVILVLAYGMFFKERQHRLTEQAKLDRRLARLSAHVQGMETATQRQRFFKLAESADELRRQEVFSQLLKQDIDANQFQDCDSAQILLAVPPAELSLADTLSWLSLGLAVGLATNRLLLVPTERLPWASSSSDWQLVATCPQRSYLCFFSPWTDCSLRKALSQVSGHRPVSFLNATGNERVVLFDLPASAPVHWPTACPLCWAAFPERSPFFLPSACPGCVFSRTWYLGQLVAWLARPNPNLASLVVARKSAVGWLAPVAGFETSASLTLSSLADLDPRRFRHHNWYSVGPAKDASPDAPYRRFQTGRSPTTNTTQLALDLAVDLLLLGESHVVVGSSDSSFFRVACRLARQRRYESLCYVLGSEQLMDLPFVDQGTQV